MPATDLRAHDAGLRIHRIGIARARKGIATTTRDPGLRSAVIALNVTERDVLGRATDAPCGDARVRRNGGAASAEQSE